MNQRATATAVTLLHVPGHRGVSSSSGGGGGGGSRSPAHAFVCVAVGIRHRWRLHRWYRRLRLLATNQSIMHQPASDHRRRRADGRAGGRQVSNLMTPVRSFSAACLRAGQVACSQRTHEHEQLGPNRNRRADRRCALGSPSSVRSRASVQRRQRSLRLAACFGLAQQQQQQQQHPWWWWWW